RARIARYESPPARDISAGDARPNPRPRLPQPSRLLRVAVVQSQRRDEWRRPAGRPAGARAMPAHGLHGLRPDRRRRAPGLVGAYQQAAALSPTWRAHPPARFPLSPAPARHIDDWASRSQTAVQRRRFCRPEMMESKLKAYLWPADGTPPPPMTRTRWRRFVDRHLPSVVIYLMVLTLVGVVLYPHMVITVPSGYVGVLWKRFGNGTVLDPRLLKNEGFNFVSPWNQVFLYDLRLQSFTESYNAISSDGVNLTASVVVRFRLQRDAVPVLHQAIGPNYKQVLIQPGIGSLTREVIAQYTAEQVYSTARQEIQEKIRDLVENRLSEKMMEHEGEESYRVSMRDTIILYDILVTGIELPAAIVGAINRKTEQYYIAEEYKFRVEREKRESERKKIEGEGIRDFQQVVSQGINESYLRWRGIEATLQLSQSTNAKV